MLWTHDLSDQIGGFPTSQGVYSRPVAVAWGGTRFVPEDTFGRRFGSIGPVTDDGVFFPAAARFVLRRSADRQDRVDAQECRAGQRICSAMTSCCSSRPRATATRWCCGPPPAKSWATRRIASFDKRMPTIGRLVLSWEAQGAEHVLQMRDPWQDQTLWSLPFATGSKAALVSQDAVGVMQPDGEFTLITLPDGKVLVKEQAGAGKIAARAFTCCDPRSQYLLVTNSSARQRAHRSACSRFPTRSTSPMVNGRVYAFDATTRQEAVAGTGTVVSQYGLLANQPSQLPVLVFCAAGAPPGRARRTRAQELAVVPRQAHRPRGVRERPACRRPRWRTCDITGDPNEHTVTVTAAARD